MIAGLPEGLAPTWKRVPPEQNRAYEIGEAGKIRFEVLRYCIGAGVDLGCGAFKIHRNALGVDRNAGMYLNRQVEANIIRDVMDCSLFANESFDFVFSSHVLEDAKNWKQTLREWWRLVKPGGNLILYLPCKGLYPPVGTPEADGGNVNHLIDLEPGDVEAAMRAMKSGWDLLENQVRGEADEYSFLQVYKKRKDAKHEYPCRVPKPERTCAVIRYGGIGDHILTSAVLPELVKDGWRIVYVTNPAGEEVVRHDPHIDEIWTDTASLTPEELSRYWNWIARRFPRCINMMNSIENFNLPQPGQGAYWLSEMARRALFGGVSYVVAQYLQAELQPPEVPAIAWHASAGEKRAALKHRAAMTKGIEDPIVILWALSGSSVHKQSPFTLDALHRVLDVLPNAVIVTTGDKAQTAQYEGHPEHPRHIRWAGEPLRASFTFAQQAADIVVGPETGIMHAVGMLQHIAKVVWLSHSNAYNLCEAWQGPVYAIEPDLAVAPCHPCHRLHWGWEHCRQHPESKAALCVHGIPAERMAATVIEAARLAAGRQAA